MPQAPDFATLYDFETQFEDAFVAVLKGQAKIPNVFPSRDAEKLRTPGLIVRFVVQNSGALSALNGTPPRLVPIRFEGSMIVEVITSRPDDPRGQNDHGRLRGLARFWLSAGANVISSVNLPYVQLLNFVPGPGTPQVNDEKSMDRSSLSFHAQFAIRDDAWPD